MWISWLVFEGMFQAADGFRVFIQAGRNAVDCGGGIAERLKMDAQQGIGPALKIVIDADR